MTLASCTPKIFMSVCVCGFIGCNAMFKIVVALLEHSRICSVSLKEIRNCLEFLSVFR